MFVELHYLFTLHYIIYFHKNLYTWECIQKDRSLHLGVYSPLAYVVLYHVQCQNPSMLAPLRGAPYSQCCTITVTKFISLTCHIIFKTATFLSHLATLATFIHSP